MNDQVNETSPEANAPTFVAGLGTVGTDGIQAPTPEQIERAKQQQAEYDAYVRRNERKQLAGLIMASMTGIDPDGNFARLADKAVTAAESLLDRLDR